jgi:hypothetical protein
MSRQRRAGGEEGDAVIDDVERGIPIGEHAERGERGAENQTRCDNDSQGFGHRIGGSLTANAAKDGRAPRSVPIWVQTYVKALPDS